jgi:hypothetical protein
LNECLEIGEEDYQTMTEATSFSEENEGEDTEEAGNDKISENVIESYLKTLFPDYSEDLAYAVNEDDNSIQIQHKDVFGNTTSTPGAKKETTYPTDATISLVFTKLELTPALFDGKKEVTAKDIIRYLGKKYPEYSPERTELQYDQKRKLIMPILKSGKRGYDLQDTEEYRLEDSPIMKVRANKYGEKFLGCVPGDFQFHLPKIPFSVLKEIMGFFWDVYVFQRTEAIAQIYYDLVSETYEIYIPEQTASPSDVEFQRNTAMEHDEGKLLVMEIHSHGSYSPVWSETDNQDEISHRLYCVVGNLQDFRYDPSHIRVRAATGGLHVLVNPDLVFAFPETLVDFNPDLIKVNVIRDEREKRLAKFRFCDRTFEVYGSYVVSENNDDYGVTYQYPEFVSLSAKESVDGNMFDFVPSGRTWSGHKVTVDDMITGLLDSQIRKDDSYTVLYMECGLKNIISSYHDDITLSANGIDIPKRVLHRENCYNLLLVTNENIYYHYDENVLLLDKNHSVISDNYFAEVGLDQSLEAIQEGREELLFDSREGEG